MPVAPGTRFGPYEVVAPVGAGGIGEVYRALDTRLKRFVAIKLLRTGAAGKPEFLQRFEREARAIASLNHAHICTVHDVGQEHGMDYLVMEYVEGITLSRHLETTRLSVSEALRYGIEIADGLAAAHHQGIIHRDLKPGNIMVTKTGIKILDFGLAKFKPVATNTGASESTLTLDRVILGTPAYMSPEQMQGKECDERTDIFALGLVLYETATGTRAFEGESIRGWTSDIVRDERLDKLAAPQFSHIVHRCLARDPASRWQSAADVKLELEWAASSPPPAFQRDRSRALAIIAGLATVGCMGAWLFWRTPGQSDRPLLRFNIDLGPGAVTSFTQPVWDRLGGTPAILSPDGSRIAFVTRGADGRQRLATRLLDQPNVSVLPGTDYAVDPFFSPNGQSLGFFAEGKLKTVSVQGGAARILGDGFSNDRGASWGEDDTIVLSPNPVSDLLRIPVRGGKPERLKGTALSHSPQVLPGTRSVLVTRDTGSGTANVEVVSLSTGSTKVVVSGGYRGRYLPSGHLIYVHNGVLFAVDFDPDQLNPRGAAVPLLNDVADQGPILDPWGNPTFPAGQFDFDRSGTFLYFSGKLTNTQSTLAWMGLSSAPKSLPLALSQYSHPRVSPDGKRLAMAASSNIWVLDFARDAPVRLSHKTNFNQQPEWTPDGQHLIYTARSGSTFGLWWARADGATEPRRLLQTEYFVAPSSISADGKLLAFHTWTIETGWDIWTVTLDIKDPEQPTAGKPRPFLVTPQDEVSASLSPDGRWVAYMSPDPESRGISVRPLSGGGGPWLIASGDCTFPTWSADGRKIYYLSTTKQIMEVDYSVQDAAFITRNVRPWSAPVLEGDAITNYAMHPDGSRAVVVMHHGNRRGQDADVHVALLFNFADEVRRRLRNPVKTF
jgi:serine/threonine-protein kinase